MNDSSKNNSTVYITGSGPGDPNLLTLKAKEIIELADVIAYDNLVSKEILELALFINPNVKIIYVGKVGGDQERSLNQNQINHLLLELAKDHKIICRLKGGDPNIFGRGGEEAIFLKEHNVNFEIIPGVSSIAAVPSYAGIPLTHRDCNSSFTVITAHEDPFDPSSKINWESFDAVNSTLVLLMGVKNLPRIIEKLISLGRKKDTPIAVIYWGTTSRQKTIVTTFENALKDIEKGGITAPSIVVIGEVVKYREMLNYFESKSLFGKKILITRSKEQSFLFANKLIRLGAKPISCPIVSYELVEKETYNKNIINNVSSLDWIFFTSQNAVKFFFEILDKNYYDSRALSKCRIATVGYKTKLELEKYNIRADFVPKRFSYEDLIKELSERENLKDKKILLPSQVGTIPAEGEARQRRHELPLQNIVEWPIYHANFIDEIPEQIINQIKEGVDVLTFFSSNTAAHFAKLIRAYCPPKADPPPVGNTPQQDIFRDSLIAVIGDETAKTCREIFGKVDIVADPFTEEGLIASIERKAGLKAGLINPALQR